jgi:predicted nucleic acid-binding protein
MKVYLDADVIIAVYDPSDLLHKRTEKISEQIFSEDYETILGVNVLIECLTLISLRLGTKISIKLLDRLFVNCQIV